MTSLENNPYTTMRGYTSISDYSAGQSMSFLFRTASISITEMDSEEPPLLNAILYLQQSPTPQLECLVNIPIQTENTLPTVSVKWVPSDLSSLTANSRADQIATNPPKNIVWKFFYTDEYGNPTSLYVGDVLTTIH